MRHPGLPEEKWWVNGRKGEERMRKGVVEGDTPDPWLGLSLPYFFLGPWKSH